MLNMPDKTYTKYDEAPSLHDLLDALDVFMYNRLCTLGMLRIYLNDDL